jgi:outer membrane protein assembly factor BamB
MKPVRTNLVIAGMLLIGAVSGMVRADWNQWRGDARDGVAGESPQLIEDLPADGLQPVWVSPCIPSAREGGWGSPVVAHGKVYLFAHVREKLRELGEVQFPWLPPEKRVGMTDEEYRQYEINRRNEDEERANAFAFREFVYCLDAATGQEVWTNRSESVYTRFPQSGSPTVLDGRVYILGAGRFVRCLDAETGDDLWRTLLPGEFRDEFMQSSVAVVDGAAVVMADHLFGLDIVTGDILWEGDAQRTRGTHSSPVLWDAGGRNFVIVNLAGGWTACFDPDGGQELWRVQSEAGHSTPVVVGDRLITYGSSRAKGVRCYAMSGDGAEELWKYRGMQDKGSSPVVVDGHVYVQGETRVGCVDLETGQAEWTDYLDLSQAQYSSPIAADGKVIYAYGTVVCFRATPDGFQPLFDARFDESHLMGSEATFRRVLNLEEANADEAERQMQRHVGRHGTLKCSSPAISDGRLYVRMKNALVCYDLIANDT